MTRSNNEGRFQIFVSALLMTSAIPAMAAGKGSIPFIR
jgi:hypothetical protein